MTGWFARLMRPEPVIEDARLADAAALSVLHGASFGRGWTESEMEHLLLDAQVMAHRVSLGARVVGFVLSRRAADEAEILSLAIEPRRRGRGLARRLLDLHLRRLAGIGVSAVFLEVDEGNGPARRLYARAAFEPVGRRPNYYPQASARSAALVLRRQL